MRKTKTFKLEGWDKQFTVNELTVKQIISLLQDDPLRRISDVDWLRKSLDRLLPDCGNVATDDLIAMAPSEIEEIWKQFQEVNKVFFATARQVGLGDLLAELKAAIIKDYSRLHASSLKLGTPAV
jgi:hypothetical protein